MNRVGLAAIFLVALALRLWGIGFGLPELYHPDEPAYVLQALAVGRALPDGLSFANPPLFKYLLLAEYAVDYGVERLTGGTRSPQEFVDQFRADPSRLYLIARVTSAIFGALTALAAGALGNAVGGRRVGLLAAALTAVAYLLVRESHFGVNDALVTLLVTLGLVFCVRVARDGRRRDYVIAGALAGLAFAAKYYGVALLAPLVVAHFAWPGAARNRAAAATSPVSAVVGLPGAPRASSNLLSSIGASVVAAVVAFPSLVTEPGRVVQDVYLHLYLDAVGGYDGLDPSGGYVFYAPALGIGLGWPQITAAMVGIIVAARRRETQALIVATFPLAFVGVLGAERLYFARFLLPALPALIVEASLGVNAVLRLQPLLGAVAAFLVALPTTVDAVRFDVLLTRPDTRTQARDWIATNLPPTAVIAADAPPLGPPIRAVISNESALFDRTLAEYRANRVEFLVVSSFTQEAGAIDPARDSRRLTFAEELQHEATQIQQFRPYTTEAEPPFMYDQIYGPFNALDALQYPGPTLTIYRLTR